MIYKEQEEKKAPSIAAKESSVLENSVLPKE